MKKLSIGTGIVVIVLVIFYGLVGNYFYNFALNAEREKEFLQDNPHLEESEVVSATVVGENKLADAEFKDKHIPLKTSIISNDKRKLQLNGFIYENEESSHKWAIVVHGYTGNSTQMIRYVRNFYEKGFNVITPDLRGHGESDGHYIGMGWHDRKDMLQWIDQIVEKDQESEIALFGVSMGAATVMMTSGEKGLPNNVKVVIEDCGYTSVMEEFAYQLDDLFNLPQFPVMNAANTVTKIRAGYDLNEASSINQLKKSHTPTLFIHGDADSFVPYEMVEDLYEAADVEKAKLIIPGAGHGEAEKVDPVTYWDTIWGFVDNYIYTEQK